MNRHSFEEVWETIESRAKQTGETFAILLGDIDGFKRLNDTFGHGVGDEVLIAVSNLITEKIRNTDYACRRGGEEFLVVLTKVNSTTAYNVGHALIKRIEQFEIPTRAGIIGVTLSVGIAVYQENETMLQLVNRADAQLYVAKHEGKNRVCIDTDNI